MPDFKWPGPILTPLQHAAWSLHPHKVRPAVGAHCAWKIVGAWSTVDKPPTWVCLVYSRQAYYLGLVYSRQAYYMGLVYSRWLLVGWPHPR